RDATCSGPELACNDDAVGLTSQVQVFLAAGQTVVVFVDTFAAPGGAFTLNISQSGPCPVNTLPGVSPQTVTGSTSGLPAAFTGTCAGAGPENTLSWTAPASGTYTIDTAGSPYDTVLYVRDVNCGGMELACDDDGGPGVTSQLQVTLVAGQTVVIFVDSFGSTGGSYTLNIAGP
ncbi:MAG TPA: hypothetical protein VFB62_26180, partial [Polyangiaceae bacterium]|nr:hypothetical protein [Polyangiaceae bacterium]